MFSKIILPGMTEGKGLKKESNQVYQFYVMLHEEQDRLTIPDKLTSPLIWLFFLGGG